ncbi:redoxin domain-containing protein [Natroniella sulfidigena]|uniref:thioredoxin family protein n=1 Tax=Natroniella sulfidigena TaxID=723921 RepID=UPI002009EE6D|nr:thioredoxin-like domain-containing protein [Natroniella sulfidigena]MCK8816071.1 redoxin domain-containing protein [Natroniella sulfidigena]
MKKLILLLVITLLVISFIIGGILNLIFNFRNNNPTITSEQEYYLPEITLNTLEEEKIKFNEITQPTILLFWLPQSKSCQQQLEVLTTINNKYSEQIKILAVGIGALSSTELKEVAEQRELDFQIVIDSQAELTEKLKVTTIPTLLLYHPQQESQKLVGFKNESELEEKLKQYFSKLTPS